MYSIAPVTGERTCGDVLDTKHVLSSQVLNNLITESNDKLFDDFFAEEQKVNVSHPVQLLVPDTPESFEVKRRRLQSVCMQKFCTENGRPPDSHLLI